ncbi:MAG: hypothetical protein KAQ85_09240, partial [Thermodesulfovibrionia bacterium]|nr:hypothetical protein [Thermodesulfovibrionia bacterium]
LAVLPMLTVAISDNYPTDADGTKSQGENAPGRVGAKSYGSANNNIVCGDRLCSEVPGGKTAFEKETAIPESPILPQDATPMVTKPDFFPFDDPKLDTRILTLDKTIQMQEKLAKSKMETENGIPARGELSPTAPARSEQTGWASLKVLPPHAKAAALITWNESLQREIIQAYDELQQYISDSQITEDEMADVERIQAELKTMQQQSEHVLSLATQLNEDRQQWEEEISSLDNPRDRDTTQAMRQKLVEEQTITKTMSTITKQLQESILKLLQ